MSSPRKPSSALPAPNTRAEAAPVHPSLIFHDIVKRLGNLVPASPKDVTVMQRRLIRAGIATPTL